MSKTSKSVQTGSALDSRLHDLYHDDSIEQFCDFKLITKDGQTFNVVSLILVLHSPVFYNMIVLHKNDFVEGPSKTAILPTISAISLKSILGFLYTGRWEFSHSHDVGGYFETCDFARQYQFFHLRNHLKSIVDEVLNAKVVWEFADFAKKLKFEEEFEAARDFIRSSGDTAWNALPFERSVSTSTLMSVLATHYDVDEMIIAENVFRWGASKATVDLLALSLFFDQSRIDVKKFLKFLSSEIKLEEKIISALISTFVENSPRRLCRNLKSFDVVAGQEFGEVLVESNALKHESILLDHCGFSHGVHSWKVEIIESSDYVWLGIAGIDVSRDVWLGRQKFGWVYGSNGYICHHAQSNCGPYKTSYGNKFGKGDVINVILNLKDDTVSFDNHGVAFNFKEDREVNAMFPIVPAVSIYRPAKVRVFQYERLS
jgi:hypothetical protein